MDSHIHENVFWKPRSDSTDLVIMRGRSSGEVILHVSFAFLHVLQAETLNPFVLYYLFEDTGRVKALEDSDDGFL